MKPKHIKAYMKCALAFAECSNATRLKVGAVIVRDNNILAVGYNALPAHINAPCELPDGSTDPRLRHAEKNALMTLTKRSEGSVGAIMFCTHSCCELCAIDIVDAGIKEFYYLHDYRCDKGLLYLQANGIVVHKITLEDTSANT